MPEPVSTVVFLTNATATVNAITAFLTAVGALVATIITTGGTIIGACAVLAKYFPPPPKGSTAEKVHKFINSVGQNAGYAANKIETND